MSFVFLGRLNSYHTFLVCITVTPLKVLHHQIQLSTWGFSQICISYWIQSWPSVWMLLPLMSCNYFLAWSFYHELLLDKTTLFFLHFPLETFLCCIAYQAPASSVWLANKMLANSCNFNCFVNAQVTCNYYIVQSPTCAMMCCSFL